MYDLGLSIYWLRDFSVSLLKFSLCFIERINIIRWICLIFKIDP